MLFNSRTEKTVDEYITPKFITDSLGDFDLDPCSPASRRPWDTAKNHIGLPDDGLTAPWSGRVWLNPPYGKQTPFWLEKLADHGDGVCLIPTRTETKYFQELVFNRADSVFFFKGRFKFHDVDGTLRRASPNFSSVLISYGRRNVEAIEKSGLLGKHIILR